ncbi:MAG: hypothetical protein JO369_05355 [Paucibacter sp.]|nr:hypothetical protein [Roseateles sp.]
MNLGHRSPGSVAPPRSVLFLDIDGVLHSRDVAFALDDVKIPIEHLLNAGLLVHRHLLWQVLQAFPKVEVVVHSAWRWTHSRSELADLLGPAGARLIGVTPKELHREASVLAWMAYRSIAPTQVVVLDDQPELFRALTSRLVVSDPALGMSKPSVLAALGNALGQVSSAGDAHGSP